MHVAAAAGQNAAGQVFIEKEKVQYGGGVAVVMMVADPTRDPARRVNAIQTRYAAAEFFCTGSVAGGNRACTPIPITFETWNDYSDCMKLSSWLYSDCMKLDTVNDLPLSWWKTKARYTKWPSAPRAYELHHCPGGSCDSDDDWICTQPCTFDCSMSSNECLAEFETVSTYGFRVTYTSVRYDTFLLSWREKNLESFFEKPCSDEGYELRLYQNCATQCAGGAQGGMAPAGRRLLFGSMPTTAPARMTYSAFSSTPSPPPAALCCCAPEGIMPVSPPPSAPPAGGCTYPSAANYDAAASVDDASCEWGSSGCTYPSAANYDAAASVDDGSCVFDCVGDGSAMQMVEPSPVPPALPLCGTAGTFGTVLGADWVSSEVQSCDEILTIAVEGNPGSTRASMCGVEWMSAVNLEWMQREWPATVGASSYTPPAGFNDAQPLVDVCAHDCALVGVGPCVGDDAAAELSPPSTVTQTITFNPIAGQESWVWFSLNVVAEDMSVAALLPGPFPGGAQLKSQFSGFTDYYEGLGWFGGLEKLSTTEMYKIRLTQPHTLTVEGTPAQLPMPLTLAGEWTWLSYPLQSPVAVADALQYNAKEGDQIKLQQAFADYYEGYGWFGTLTTLEPGQGYKLKAACAADGSCGNPRWVDPDA